MKCSICGSSGSEQICIAACYHVMLCLDCRNAADLLAMQNEVLRVYTEHKMIMESGVLKTINEYREFLGYLFDGYSDARNEAVGIIDALKDAHKAALEGEQD